MSDQEFIPDDEFKADKETAAPMAQGTTGPRSPSNQSFIPDDEFVSDEEKYGSLPQQALAGVESAASAATLGFSRHLENASGLTTPEAQAQREEQNPITSTVGGIAGTAALIAGTGGLGGLAEGASTAAKIGTMALEGGVLGAGNANADLAMGDPNLNAQKLLTHIGFGAALGAGGGLLFESLLPAAGSKIKSVKDAISRVYGSGSKAISEKVGSAIEGQPSNIVDSPAGASVKNGVKPTSIEEIQNKVNEARFSGSALEMPQKTALEDAASRIEMEHPVHPMQTDSLNSQRARDAYQTAKEMGDEGQALQQYEALQKGELVAKTDNTIQNIAGENNKVIPDAVQSGNKAIEYFSDQYQNEKKELAPFFKNFDKAAVSNVTDKAAIVDSLSNEIPDLGKILKVDPKSGIFDLEKYDPTLSISKNTHGALEDLVTALNKDDLTIGGLRNLRETMRDRVNWLSAPREAAQITGIRQNLMDYIEKNIDSVMTGDYQGSVRDIFRRYAINEQQRGVIEKAFGASVGTPEFGAISKIKPEMIADRIFSNTANVAAAKNILPKEQFDHLLASWLSEARTAATDKGAFSSNKFGSFLKRNQDALNAAFSDNPHALERLKDMTTIMRILPDSASVNPSGTAKTLINYLKESHNLSDIGLNALKFIKDKTLGKVESQVNLQNLNSRLSGKEADLTVKKAILNAVKNTTSKIESSADSIFRGNTKRVIGGVVASQADHYKNHVDNIQKLSSSDYSMFNHLDQSNKALYSAAPNITQGINSAVSRGVQFLNSKLPKPNSELLLSEKWEPSPSQKDKFNRYYNAVNDPISALKDIKQGILSNETMEALQAVHPDLLQEMREKVIESLDPKKAKNINYSTKISLSKFLGEPLDSGMVPSVIMANQAAYAMPQGPQQQQGKQKKSSVSGLSKIGVSSRASTMSQRLDKEEA